MKRLIIFLIRRRLGLKKYEDFQFVNQKAPNEYYMFNDDSLRKFIINKHNCKLSSRASSVSLNWLLDDECKIRRVYFDDASMEVKSIEN